MEIIKNVVISVSVTLVFLGVAIMLMPDGSMKIPFKSFVSVCLVSVLVLAFSSGTQAFNNIEFDDYLFDDSKQNELVEGLNNTSLSVAEQTVEQIVVDSLKQKGVSDAQVSVLANISDEGIISITETVIYCSKSDIAVCKKVLDELGLLGKVCERNQDGA